ncbi:MAG: hypothetical protein ACLFUJ_14440 [Phycisphaerae bacterium]
MDDQDTTDPQNAYAWVKPATWITIRLMYAVIGAAIGAAVVLRYVEYGYNGAWFVRHPGLTMAAGAVLFTLLGPTYFSMLLDWHRHRR